MTSSRGAQRPALGLARAAWEKVLTLLSAVAQWFQAVWAAMRRHCDAVAAAVSRGAGRQAAGGSEHVSPASGAGLDLPKAGPAVPDTLAAAAAEAEGVLAGAPAKAAPLLNRVPSEVHRAMRRPSVVTVGTPEPVGAAEPATPAQSYSGLSPAQDSPANSATAGGSGKKGGKVRQRLSKIGNGLKRAISK